MPMINVREMYERSVETFWTSLVCTLLSATVEILCCGFFCYFLEYVTATQIFCWTFQHFLNSLAPVKTYKNTFNTIKCVQTRQMCANRRKCMSSLSFKFTLNFHKNHQDTLQRNNRSNTAIYQDMTSDINKTLTYTKSTKCFILL